MRKQELIQLANELNGLKSLKGRENDLSLLKREFRKLQNREEDSFFEANLTKEFMNIYDELAKKESSLSASSFDEKKGIIARANELLKLENVLKASKEMDELFVSFKQAGRCSKEQDDELWNEFNQIRKQINDKKHEHFATIRAENKAHKEAKEALISKAKEILNLENIKDATNKMEALMEEWKKAGYAGKEFDEKLWGEFSAIRKEFSKKRKEHFEHMKDVYAERVTKKEALIKEAKKLVADADWSDNELKLIKGLRSEYRTIGFAGKENEDDLYERFEKVIKQYFDEKKFYNE